MELEKLKAHAYDCALQVEAWQKKLKEANNAIIEYNEKNPKVEETTKEEKKK